MKSVQRHARVNVGTEYHQAAQPHEITDPGARYSDGKQDPGIWQDQLFPKQQEVHTNDDRHQTHSLEATATCVNHDPEIVETEDEVLGLRTHAIETEP